MRIGKYSIRMSLPPGLNRLAASSFINRFRTALVCHWQIACQCLLRNTNTVGQAVRGTRETLKRVLWAGVLMALVGSALLTSTSLAHDPRLTLPEPQSVPEAWNVIEESVANVDKLLEAGLLPDIAFQIANTSPALRLLDAHAAEDREPQTLPKLTKHLLTTGFDVILASREKSEPFAKTKVKWEEYRKILKELESRYPPETLRAAVYICPMHPLDRHLKPGDKCAACGMALVRRHIPASTIYEKPGEPSMKLRVLSSPLVVGQLAEIKVRLTKGDGSPVTLADLVEMHTQRIHLLINDQSLSDYHHEHPKPTGVPGEYAFSFTPAKPGPYRIWADVVPASTSIQEYVIADIPADTAPASLSDRQTVFTAIVEGRKYDLAFQTDGKPIHAGQTVIGSIAVTGADGKPFIKLEPVMGAFAHIVGFSEDRKTILHVHPYTRDPIGPEDRAGPAFAFKLYAPTAGFLRLYGQVQIDGVSQFAPFGLNILPPLTPTSLPTTSSVAPPATPSPMLP